MMPKIIYLLLILVLSVNLTASGNENDNSVHVYINLDKLVFEENESILLRINIKNNSENMKFFNIYDSDYVTFRPVIYDLNGREPDTLVPYRLENKKIADVIKNVQPRNIALNNNEIFSHIVKLNDIYSLKPDTEYRVKAVFSPDSTKDTLLLSINDLKFKVLKAGNAGSGSIQRFKKYITPERKFSPSEIITLFLKAEKGDDWDNYFKYIDIEKYISAYPEYVKIFNQAVYRNDIVLKEKIILEFIDFLKAKRSDYILSYEVMDELTRNESSYFVDVMVRRKSNNIYKPYVYKYRYSLDKHENLWIVTGIEATVIKENRL